MQIPEQVARDTIVVTYGPADIYSRDYLLTTAELIDIITLGIKTAQAQYLEQARALAEGLLSDDMSTVFEARDLAETFIIEQAKGVQS